MKIVIIGAGPAGVSTAETLRAHDHQSQIVMLSAEPYLPYSPPAMADHFLTGSTVHLWRAHNWAQQWSIEYQKAAEVTRIEPTAHCLHLKNGQTIHYDRLVITTGSRLYAPVEGAHMPGVYNFKSLSAAEAIISQVKGGKAQTATIVGAGFIGMEIALLLSDLGVKVTQIEMLDQVMANMLDKDTAAVALDLMRKRGIEIRLKTRAKAFIGEQKAQGVELESGEILESDILVAATGVQPNIDLLEGSGIEYQWGIRVDAYLRTTAPDVYAAGDVIEAPDRLTGETYVHPIFPNAVEQGRVVGMNLAGLNVRYEGAERMNSLKHLGLPIVVAGLKEGDEVLQEKRNGQLRTLYLKANQLVGFQLVGDIRSAGILRTLMYQRQDVHSIKHHLLDPNFGQGTIVWNALTPYI